MSKKDKPEVKESESDVIVEDVDVDEESGNNETEGKVQPGEISLDSYLPSGFDKYRRAYLVTRYLGQLKTKEQWSQVKEIK